MKSSKEFSFEIQDGNICNGECLHKLNVVIPEIVEPQYGMFVWPSAPVLAQYIFQNQDDFRGKHILEIGAGTALPGIVAAKVGGNVTLSDSEQFPNCLENCRQSCKANQVESRVDVISLTWGLVNDEFLALKPVDIILGSDCFYDKKDFEDILFTISFLMEINPSAVFLTTYQLRSAEYSLEPMLRKWKLQWKQIPLSTFCCSQSLEYKHEIQMYEIRKRKER